MVSIEKQIKAILQDISKKKFETGPALMNACQETISKAAANKIYLTLATLDEHGHLNFLYRHPEALFVSLELAQKKAYTAYAMQMNSSQLQTLTQPGKPLYQLETSSEGKIVSFAGGIYIPAEQLIGLSAIGVSGSLDPADDEAYGEQFLLNYQIGLK